MSTIITLTATTLTCDRYVLSMSGNERVLCKKKKKSTKRREMFTPREKKFVTVKLVKKLGCNIRCCSVMLCCVNACDSSIWAPSRHSVLPHRLLCHNKITGGLLDSSSPQGLLLTFFFFSQSLEQTLSSFAIKDGEKNLEKLNNGGEKILFFPIFRCKTIWDCESATWRKIFSCTYKNEVNIGEGLMFHFGKQKNTFHSHSALVSTYWHDEFPEN